jgi:predicted Zn-dependent protease
MKNSPEARSSDQAVIAEGASEHIPPLDFDQLLNEVVTRGRLTWPGDAGEDNLEALYIAASQAFDRGQYQDALEAFGLLVATDPLDCRFHHAVGASLQRLGRYKEAAAVYVQLQILEPESPEGLFRAAECVLAIGDNAAAIDMLDALAVDYPGDITGWAARASALRQLLARADDAGDDSPALLDPRIAS